MKPIAIILIIVSLVFISSNPAKSAYEICDDNGLCKQMYIDKLIKPSSQTFEICNPDALKSGAENICEQVPINRLLLKGGTDKKYCSNAPYLSGDYLDNWWNSNGLIDECEMPPKADMQFIFKSHNQTIYNYTGIIQIKIGVINYESDYKALQIIIGEDNNNDNLPDDWIHCGNVDQIQEKDIKFILCNGTNIKFIKLVNAEWNKGNLYIDDVEVLKAEVQK